ncbi:MAG: dienelactone hydrolase family protein [Blastocatellia bacterium]|nr:dienelactone hydrolase family protein [Blastocatellia bacterium]
MSLKGFSETSFTNDNVTRTVYRKGKGPGVVIMHEIPGITPQVAAFAERVADVGLTAVMPLLFGTPGKPISLPYLASQMFQACISKEFNVLAKHQASPITNWLRSLCRQVYQECGGKGVGAIGMCLTGGFALSLMVDECVMAPVLSQPSVPFPITASHRAALGISDEELTQVKARVAKGCTVLGLRFTGDPMCPKERFETLRQELGNGFEGIEIDSSPNNSAKIKSTAHSVVTTDLVDKEGHPTYEALHRVLEMFKQRLI